jgi:PIF1 helicase.
MSINKSQGQFLEVCGINLELPCFLHGLLYVACLRVGKPSTLFVFSPYGKTKNIVHHKNKQSPARLQHIMFNLAPYSPKVIFKKGTEIPLADFLSRYCDATNLKYEQEENLKVSVILPMSIDGREELIIAKKRRFIFTVTS